MMYRSEFYVFGDGKPVPAIIRNYSMNDFDELIQIQSECFPPPFPSELWWNKEQLSNHVTRFPEGALCIELGGELAGSLTGLIVEFDPNQPQHKWEEATDHGYIRNHNPNGNTLYIVDISVRPKYRQFGLGKLMMQAMYHVVIQKGLERLLGGGRMPGYKGCSSEMTPEQYLALLALFLLIFICFTYLIFAYLVICLWLIATDLVNNRIFGERPLRLSFVVDDDNSHSDQSHSSQNE